MKPIIAAQNKLGARVSSIWNKRRSHLLAFVMFSFAAIFVSVPLAYASSQGMQFTSQVSSPNACTINVIRDGDFGISADKKVLSSKIAGGQSAIADVTGRQFQITAEAPTGFSLGPTNAALNTTFQARFSGVRAFPPRTFLENDGSVPIRMVGRVSTTRLNIHLIATRIGSTYPSGVYVGTVVVRCE